MHPLPFAIPILAVALVAPGPRAGEVRESLDVAIMRSETSVRVDLDETLFTELHFGPETSKPHFHPLLGPNGEHVTRGFPIEPRPDEAADHPHHTSMWFAHGDVNGHDFWHGGKGERIVHLETRIITGGEADSPSSSEPQEATTASNAGAAIESFFEWRAPDGVVVCTERRVVAFSSGPGVRVMDFLLELGAAGEDVVFGDTKEGTFAMRLAPTLRLRGPVAAGTCLNSEGHRDGECWGKRAKWVEYSGPIDGRTIGVAIFDHPLNPRHPTWWHARDYGLFAANPFGVHDFEGAPAGTGNLLIEAGRSRTWRYRVLIHEGAWAAEALDDAFEAFAAGR